MMIEDTLFPHGDEAGRVPGAMYQPNAVIHSTESARKDERNRLVWEAMLRYMADDFNVLSRAVRIVDEYLEWRGKQ